MANWNPNIINVWDSWRQGIGPGKYLLKNMNRYRQAHTHFQTLSAKRTAAMPPKQWAELASRFSRQTDKASGVKPEKWVHMMSLRKYPRHTYDGRRSTGHGSQLKKLPPIRGETAVNRLEPETQHNLWGFTNIKEDWINVGVGGEETHLICGRITDNWFIYLADTVGGCYLPIPQATMAVFWLSSKRCGTEEEVTRATSQWRKLTETLPATWAGFASSPVRHAGHGTLDSM